MKLRKALAQNVRQLREARGMSQEDLADAAQIDRTYVSAIERQRYAVSIDVLERLAEALEVEPSQLLIASNDG
jgi:transcriptional regulator with XRE-family HTH domain